jgi:hypothetical protein
MDVQVVLCQWDFVFIVILYEEWTRSLIKSIKANTKLILKLLSQI